MRGDDKSAFYRCLWSETAGATEHSGGEEKEHRWLPAATLSGSTLGCKAGKKKRERRREVLHQPNIILQEQEGRRERRGAAGQDTG